VNEVGQSFTLSELAELSTSNPELRRNELMTRVKGAEAIALARGDVGLFVTTTLPSRFHAVSDRYDGSTPRQGQAALCIGWARSRALLAKEGIRLYGMRVAEPHLDGTPHAHALIFCAPHQVERVKAVLRERALEESPNEDGAQRHRFTCERINSEMGSAVAYVSKYLAKNVDGFQLEMTLARKKDGGWELVDKNPQTAAERIRTWASTWGIRQFQFFGLPPVTWWRELRRLREGCVSPVIEEARAPADAGDYAGHVTAVGGVCKPRADLALCTWRTYESAADGQPATNRYGEPSPPKLCGVGELGRKLYVEVGPQPLYRLSWNEEPVMLARELTRVHTWEVVINAPASAPAPWTRVNNCNQPGELAGDSAGLAGPDLPDFYRPGARPPRLHPPPGG
ncbi:MAG: replication endonuclease, partial [Nevskia sp.]|nr:replication endonuclease [Nevskia sp.]